MTGIGDGTVVVRLTDIDVDHLLALAEWALNHPDPRTAIENAAKGIYRHGKTAEARLSEANDEVYHLRLALLEIAKNPDRAQELAVAALNASLGIDDA